MDLDPYNQRLQTKTKHEILKRYLQTLSFKILSFANELAYIDGFSGPWKSQTENFSDTSFMIALTVLKDVQKKFAEQRKSKQIKCFLVESDAKACAKLREAVASYHRPDEGFEVIVRCSKFEDAVDEAKEFIGRAFALTFIDPTGWTGYRYERIAPLLQHQFGEVVINFMFDHVNRFREHPDEKIITSMDGIFGGTGWTDKLDRSNPGPSLVEMYREALKSAGQFNWVLAVPIDKSTEDRPHFYLVYGTRSDKGLEAFREVEHSAIKAHQAARQIAKAGKKEAAKAASTGMQDMFGGLTPPAPLADQTDEIARERSLASDWIVEYLKDKPIVKFRRLWPHVLDRFRLKTTDVRKILNQLAKNGVIVDTWTGPKRKVPQDDDLIGLAAPITSRQSSR